MEAITMEIEKVYEKGKTARWRITSPVLARRETHLVWSLHPDPENPENPVEAHFQFGLEDLLQDHPGGGSLTRDLTAVIDKPNGKLKLKVKDDTCRRRNPRRYAVWVKDPALKSGGVFAVGTDMNPPPEIDVGG